MAAKMNEDQVQRQLNNMKNFIIQEAEEKRDEIKLKAKEEFTIEKSSIFQAERVKIIKEFERREKQKEVEKKIVHSNQLNQARLRVLKARDDIIQELKEECLKRLAKVSSGDQYEELLQKLIVQALLKLRETDVKIRCREQDDDIVRNVMKDAAASYKQKTNLDARLEIDTVRLPPAPTSGTDLANTKQYCNGGVVLSAKEGRILCNNTLDQRLTLAFEANIPEIRKQLFA
eukprot:TRINITY_DN427_c0_g1_i1.p1 TRINITY_DN427_c0_g1~~TRINITY_DN427_c0_g1_i1.p1  ORF type:complete len:251 (+),score=65.01 TRINITY_DN427_c0_g1_i1:61-753(+)